MKKLVGSDRVFYTRHPSRTIVGQFAFEWNGYRLRVVVLRGWIKSAGLAYHGHG